MHLANEDPYQSAISDHSPNHCKGLLATVVLSRKKPCTLATRTKPRLETIDCGFTMGVVAHGCYYNNVESIDAIHDLCLV
jgi:hypothetical protein